MEIVESASTQLKKQDTSCIRVRYYETTDQQDPELKSETEKLYIHIAKRQTEPFNRGR